MKGLKLIHLIQTALLGREVPGVRNDNDTLTTAYFGRETACKVILCVACDNYVVAVEKFCLGCYVPVRKKHDWIDQS